MTGATKEHAGAGENGSYLPDEPDYLRELAARGSPQTRRRTFAALGAVFAVVLLGVLFGVWKWQQHVSSPLYTLKLLEQAVGTQDPVEVARYFDTQGVARDLYEGAAADLGRSVLGEEYAWLVEGLSSVAEPLVVDRLTDQLLAAILEDSQAAEKRVIPDPAVASIEHDGSRAVAAVPLADGREVRFLMLQAGNRWRVVGIENAAEVYRDLLEAVGLSVPELGSTP